MKKIVLVMLMATLLLVLPAQAQDSDLSSLARYVPDDTPIYAALDTSTGSLETLDALFGRLAPMFGAPAGTSFMDMLDEGIQYMDPEGDFNSLIGSWLGDSIALSVITPTGSLEDGETYVFMSVTDELRASKYIHLVLENNYYGEEYSISDYAGGTLYLAPEDAAWEDSYWLGSDVLVVLDSSYDGFNYEPPTEGSLADSAKFNDTVALLPEDTYGAMLYLDTQAILQMIDETDMAQVEEMMPGMNLAMFQEAVGAQVWGFGLIQGRHLTIDLAQSVSLGVMESAGFPMNISGLVDPTFAQYIPADAALVLHDTQLGETIAQTLDTLVTFGDVFSEMRQNQIDESGYAPESLNQAANLDELVAFLRLSYQGLSGSSLDESTAWMTGDYAAYVALPLVDDTLSVDFGLVTALTDAAAAAEVNQSVINILDAWGTEYAVDGQVVTVDAMRQMAERMQAMEMDEDVDLPELPDLDILFGYNDAVYAFGTRPGVENAFNGGSSLSDSASYQAASEAFLPNTQAIAYVDTQIVASGLYELDAMGARDVAEVAGVLSQFDSASITADYGEDGTGLVRFVLTLPN